MTTPTTPNDDAAKTAPAVRDALLAGLAEVKRQGLKVRYAPRGSGKTTARVQMEMTAIENSMLQMLRHSAGLVMGRPISKALLLRVAFGYLMSRCVAALKDPVQAERLRQDIMKARIDRLGEFGKVAS